MVDTQEKTYIYEGKEWVLTGRQAKKVIFSKRDVNKQIGTFTILEIHPLGQNDKMFYKWVDPRELFFVEEETDIDVSTVQDDNEDVLKDSKN